MSENERALATLQDLLDSSIFVSRIDFALEVAIEALREKQACEKGCEYCKVLTPDCCKGFFLPSIDSDCEADMVTITHCPMCGKRLEVEHVNETTT